MALVVTIIDQYSDGHRTTVYGTVQLTGSYTTTGVLIDFAGGLTGSGGVVESQYAPVWLEFTPFAGYAILGVVGTDINTNKIQIYSAPGTELTAGAFPAALLNGNVQFNGIWYQLQ